jgi:hypothetical protein
MNLEEKQAHAARLLALILQDPEYSFVYEDEELMDESEETQLEILGLMSSAEVQITWAGVDGFYTVNGESDE